VQRDELAFTEFSDAEPNGVGTDINCGKDRHSLSGEPRLVVDRRSRPGLFFEYGRER
jgi:hypothetical protein